MNGSLHWIYLPFGARIWVRIDSTELEEELRRIEEKLKNMRAVWNKSANIMRRSFADNFKMGGRPERWKPLKQGTVTGKSMNAGIYSTMKGRHRIRRLDQFRMGRSHRSLTNPLVFSGEYRDSWTQKNQNHFERVRKDGIEIGSTHYLAPIHEGGSGLEGPRGSKYEIKPIKAKSLRFYGPNGPVFAKSVMNPGVPSRPVGLIQAEDIDAITAEMVKHIESR